jgi:energy-coupling factor transporter ATP-binding protein EcfA2
MRPPRLLLLDEPYAAFDADGVELVNEFVRETVRCGGAALVSTHDLSRAIPVVNRVVRIVDGLAVHGAPPDADELDDGEQSPSPIRGLWSAEGGLR